MYIILLYIYMGGRVFFFFLQLGNPLQMWTIRCSTRKTHKCCWVMQKPCSRSWRRRSTITTATKSSEYMLLSRSLSQPHCICLFFFVIHAPHSYTTHAHTRTHTHPHVHVHSLTHSRKCKPLRLKFKITPTRIMSVHHGFFSLSN
jgi:hypothetical protein